MSDGLASGLGASARCQTLGRLNCLLGIYQAFDHFHSATGEIEMHGNHGEYSTNVREHSGHNRHAGHSVAMFRDKFWLSLGLTIPVVVWSSEVQHWLGYRAPTFPGSRLIPAILGNIIFVYGGSVFIQGARGELSTRPPRMT